MCDLCHYTLDWPAKTLCGRYDNCNCQAGDPIIDRFTAMRDALNRTGRPVLYSMCLWGTGDAWRWGGQVRQHCKLQLGGSFQHTWAVRIRSLTRD